MNRHVSSLRSWYERLRRQPARGVPPSRPKRSIGAEMLTGALVGLSASALIGWQSGADGLVLLFAALAGAGTGSVIGLLLWLEGANLPDDPVPPPATRRRK